MATSTDNLNLRKPDTTDNWSVQDDFNANMGKIDDFAGLFMIDFGSKSVSAFQDALSSTMSEVANGQSVSFTVNFTDSVSPMSSGAHTGVATRSSSTRINVILQRSGSATNDSYLGSLTSNGWAWDKVSVKSEVDALGTQISSRARAKFVSWGSTITADDFHHGLLLLAYSAAYIVWFASTAQIAMRSLRTSDGSKEATGSTTFSADDVNGTAYTITRNGSTITVTNNSSSNTTMTLIYV